MLLDRFASLPYSVRPDCTALALLSHAKESDLQFFETAVESWVDLSAFPVLVPIKFQRNAIRARIAVPDNLKRALLTHIVGLLLTDKVPYDSILIISAHAHPTVDDYGVEVNRLAPECSLPELMLPLQFLYLTALSQVCIISALRLCDIHQAGNTALVIDLTVLRNLSVSRTSMKCIHSLIGSIWSGQRRSVIICDDPRVQFFDLKPVVLPRSEELDTT